MRLLLTAFEPFDESGLNSSLEAARAFLAESAAEDLRFLVLPVEYGEDTRLVDEAVSAWEPDALLHLGQGGGGAARVERLAVNVRYEGSRLAETGPDAPQRLIEPDGPPACFATAPVAALTEAIQARGVPARLSNHAGIYLCNHVLYQSLRRAQRLGLAQRIGFLHLPPLPEQLPHLPEPRRSEPLPREQLAAAVAAAVAACRR